MRVRELTEDEYKASWHGDRMINSTDTAEEVLDIWPYVRAVMADSYPDLQHTGSDVYRIYESEDGEIHHVYVDVGVPNLHLVIVVSVVAREIEGHYHLNLGKLYGLLDS